MKLMFALIATAIVLAFLESDQGGKPTPKPTGAFRVRLETSLAVKDFTTRDRMLKEVALDAATAGDGEAATRAVAGIIARELKDEVASESALRLAAAGAPEAANKVAITISAPNLRKATLEKLAQM